MRKNRPLSELKDYIDLYELMRCCRGTHEENRAFGLQHNAVVSKPLSLLGSWVSAHRHRIKHPERSRKISTAVRNSALLLAVFAFAIGVFTGTGLLSYSGNEPVNIIYFLAFAFLLPLLSTLLGIVAMLQARKSDAFLVHISPAFWMQRILERFFKASSFRAEHIPFNPLLANWMVIVRAQEFSLAFYSGLFFALLAVVTGKDIAFAWSSTLPLDAGAFHHLLSLIALPWRSWLPQAVPSMELIEQSRYFRLGGTLEHTMVQHAALLGEWWKFLAMTTLVYALVLRLGLLLLAAQGYKRALERSMLSLEGVKELLRQIREPLISTHAHDPENARETPASYSVDLVRTPAAHYPFAAGWAMDEKSIALHNDREGISADTLIEAGGMRTLEEDQENISSITGDVLLYVKAWEPPTMDFIDFLQALHQNSSGTVLVYPLGTPRNDYRADDEAFDTWARKIGALKLNNVRMKR